MKEKIEQYLQQKEVLTNELKEWVKNKSIPLEERWEVFIDSDLGKNDYFYWNFKSLDNDSYHADREKYSTCTVEHVIDYFMESTDEEINLFKEEALEEFIYSWQFDW